MIYIEHSSTMNALLPKVLKSSDSQRLLNDLNVCGSMDASKKSAYKVCFVPKCRSTTLKTSGKSFVTVPLSENKRRMWFEAVRRDYITRNQNTRFHCCIDHFKLEDDFENHIKHKLTGAKLIIKDDVVPHIFDCQTDRNTAKSPTPRPYVLKRKREELIREAFQSAKNVALGHERLLQSSVAAKFADSEQPSTSKSFLSMEPLIPPEDNMKLCDKSPSDTVEKQISTSEDEDIDSSDGHSDEARGIEECGTNSKYIQANIRPKYRSKGVQCKVRVSEVASSPFKLRKSEVRQCISFSQSDSSQSNTKSDEERSDDDASFSDILSTPSTDTFVSNTEETDDTFESNTDQTMESLIQKAPKRYLGLNKHHLFVTGLLMKSAKVTQRNLFLSLMKIRLNDSFDRLGDQFGIKKSYCSKIFKETIPLISHFMSTLIFFNETHNKLSLPISFRANFSKVRSIIDCFEIQIQKPSNPIHQALTWSEYKKCNTVKYLVSCEPHGFINYISKGYGGRISDQEIVKVSDYLEKLPPKCQVMADRGFKHIEPMLAPKDCKLIRPPSVAAGTKMSRDMAVETKRIAALRIHVERLIRRYREYHLLAPHSTVDNTLIGLLDEIVVIVSGLINLQPLLLKK